MDGRDVAVEASLLANAVRYDAVEDRVRVGAQPISQYVVGEQPAGEAGSSSDGGDGRAARPEPRHPGWAAEVGVQEAVRGPSRGLAGQPQTLAKELTVSVELVGGKPVTVLELLRGIRLGCGGILACRSTGRNTFEVTMSAAKGKAKLLDGFLFDDTSVLAKPLANDKLVISCLSLPA